MPAPQATQVWWTTRHGRRALAPRRIKTVGSGTRSVESPKSTATWPWTAGRRAADVNGP